MPTAIPPAASPPAASARRPASRRHRLCAGGARQARGTILRRCARDKDSRRHPPPALHPTSLSQRMTPMAQTYFTEDHEWIRVEGGIATVGITNYAQEQLGDLVFVELPEAGRKLAKGDVAVVVESVKAASDVYAPADGEITEANTALSSDPALVNSVADRRRLALEDETHRREPAVRPDGRSRLQCAYRLSIRSRCMTTSTYTFAARHIGPGVDRHARHARRGRRAFGRNADRAGRAEVDPARPSARPARAGDRSRSACRTRRQDERKPGAEELYRRRLSRHASCRRSSSAICSRTRPGTPPTRPTSRRSARAGWNCCSTSRRW